jgi:hypothetical protein
VKFLSIMLLPLLFKKNSLSFKSCSFNLIELREKGNQFSSKAYFQGENLGTEKMSFPNENTSIGPGQ